MIESGTTARCSPTNSGELTLVLEKGCGLALHRHGLRSCARRWNSPMCRSSCKPRHQFRHPQPTVCRESRRRWSSPMPDGRQIELFSRWQFTQAGRTGARYRRQQARPRGALCARSGPDREILFRRSGFSRSPTGSRKTSSSCAAASSTTPSILRAALMRGCTTWRSNCAMPRTCSRPATCSDADKIQLLWGPVRHGPGHNIATYHRNPDGYLIELVSTTWTA